MVSRILCLVVIVGGGHPAASLAQEPPSFAEVVQPYVDRGQMAGASGVVVTPTSVLTFPTVGYADLESKRPMREDTLFWMASTSKPVHATAVMMLVDDGKLKLDDPVSKYLPDFKPRLGVTDADGKQRLRAPEHAITVRMLLNHTSGLEFSDPAARMPPADCCSLTELVARFVSLPLLFEPGTKFAYSDAGPGGKYHSVRSAAIGSMHDARQAGIMNATRDPEPSNNVAIVSMTGSHGCTPNS